MKFIKERKDEFLEGKKIKYIAKEVGLTNVHLCNILNGKTSCKNTTAIFISEYLNKDVNKYFKN
jgi:plasmid maintenance system antidote protein VapI